MKLRWYQSEAKEAIYDFLRNNPGRNPCAVLPTGAGKTPLLAEIARDAVTRWDGRVLIVSHVKELLQQAADKLSVMCPDVEIGVYSAGLDSRDKHCRVTVAGVQSIYKWGLEFDPFDLVIIDEAHLIPLNGNGMYQRLIADLQVANPRVRLIGLTATPYRLKDGYVCQADGPLHEVCYEVGVKQLIVEGYLCPLISKAGTGKADMSSVKVTAGEYNRGDLENAFCDADLVEDAVTEIVKYTGDRKSVLVFSAGIAHGNMILDLLSKMTGDVVDMVTGDTPSPERAEVIERFKRGECKYLVNCNVLTTGFDVPNVDCVALVRATLSPGLYYQMVGRGFRVCDGKPNCLVLDFGENIVRHGPVDQIRVKSAGGDGEGEAPAKVCPECQEVVAAGFAVCPMCGFEFPPPEASHDGTASDASPISGEAPVDWDVSETRYAFHKSKSGSITMRVDYQVGFTKVISEWVCVEHQGFAKEKAHLWWKCRCEMEMPDTVEEAVELGSRGWLAEPSKITVTKDGQFNRIIGYELGEIPRDEPGSRIQEYVNKFGEPVEEDDIPF